MQQHKGDLTPKTDAHNKLVSSQAMKDGEGEMNPELAAKLRMKDLDLEAGKRIHGRPPGVWGNSMLRRQDNLGPEPETRQQKAGGLSSLWGKKTKTPQEEWKGTIKKMDKNYKSRRAGYGYIKRDCDLGDQRQWEERRTLERQGYKAVQGKWGETVMVAPRAVYRNQEG